MGFFLLLASDKGAESLTGKSGIYWCQPLSATPATGNLASKTECSKSFLNCIEQL